MVERRLTAAVIGCGRMGARTRPELARRLSSCWYPLSHADGLASLPDLELAAFCDLNKSAADDAVRRYGVQRAYDDYRMLIDEVRPDILTIATRTPGRAAIIQYAATHGVRALHVEKPLCQNLAEGAAAASAVREHGVAFSYGTLRRYTEPYRRAEAIVRSGDLGEIRQVIVKHGRTSLLWNHPHSIDVMCFFAGSTDVRHVQGDLELDETSVAGNVVDADPIVNHATLQFANGVTGAITSAGGLSVTVACSTGEVSVESDGAWLEIRRRAPGSQDPYYTQVTREHPRCTVSGTQAALLELAAAVRHGTPTSLTIDDALKMQRIIYGIVASHLDGGTRFDVTLVDVHFTITGRLGDLYA